MPRRLIPHRSKCVDSAGHFSGSVEEFSRRGSCLAPTRFFVVCKLVRVPRGGKGGTFASLLSPALKRAVGADAGWRDGEGCLEQFGENFFFIESAFIVEAIPQTVDQSDRLRNPYFFHVRVDFCSEHEQGSKRLGFFYTMPFL